MSKYEISTHCRYVKGALGSAIYDLKNNAVFSLNPDATCILDSALSGHAAENTCEFLDKLCERQLLNCSLFEVPTPDTADKLSLRYVWLELTNRCNCECIHCYGAFGLPTHEDIAKELSLDAWKEILRLIRQFGGNAIQLIGGELLLFPDFCELLQYAHNIGIENIDIFTNGTLLNEDIIHVIKMTGAAVRVSLYGYDEKSHERITQCRHSFARLDHALDLLREANIPTRIAVVLMEENQADLDQIIAYIESKGHRYTGFDTVREVRHSVQNSHEVTDINIARQRFMTKPSFHTSCPDYNRNQRWNSCWYGKLAITASGDVIPCIFARDQLCGNIRTDSLDHIKKELVAHWGLNKDKVEVCKDCEFRYACDDCRPLADGKTGDIHAKYPRCLYDPYTASWK